MKKTETEKKNTEKKNTGKETTKKETTVKEAADGAEKLSVEEIFERLEETIGQLESGDLTLEASLKAYEQGMRYIRLCNGEITQAEKKVLVIRENGETDEF